METAKKKETTKDLISHHIKYVYRVDSRLAPSQWEMLLQSNAISHWLGANLESALILHPDVCTTDINISSFHKIIQESKWEWLRLF